MIDIDHFKQINDRCGHAAGDEVLREVTQRIESQIRATDVAARYGGEEFVVLLPGTDLDSGHTLAERIRAGVASSPCELGNGERRTVTVSVGAASTAPARAVTDLKTLGDALLARADVALYQAKSDGRNKVRRAAGDAG